MQKHSLFAIALVVGVAVVLPASAQVYKWKDEQGRTVISDKPRPGSGGHEQVTSTPQKDHLQEKPTQTVTPEQSIADKELEFRKRQQEQREAAAKAEQDRLAAEQKAENCKRAQNYLQALESGQRVSQPDASGALIPMDDSARQRAIEEQRANVRSQCSG
ncbi:MAG: DUF4124 domain-containing protein [Zoogloeaceae bacterium]|jgi:hypothetical protein|nr:DUF4124 domain-containing protein [Zoogloeaceae bacterium]